MKKLTKTEEQRKQAALVICKTLSNETSVIAKPLSSIDVKNIPNSVEPLIRNWIRKKANHEVYGSASMATHLIHARKPHDLDLVVSQPSSAANSLSALMRRHGVKTRIISKPDWDSYVIQTKDTKGVWVNAIDIHPAKGHYGKYELYGNSRPSLNVRGINLQQSSDQLLRKFNAITHRRLDGSMGGSPQREVKDTDDAIQIAEVLLASMELKSRVQLLKARKVKDAIEVWKVYLRRISGRDTKREKQISSMQTDKFVRKAVENPSKNLDSLVFMNGEITERVVPNRKNRQSVIPTYVDTEHYYVESSHKKQQTSFSVMSDILSIKEIVNKKFK